jgi:two-component system chemotaxis sensor kinase CheA
VDLSRYTALFLTESREQLAACGHALLEWERVPEAQDPVVALFRAMHTFKGMAAAMGYANLTELAHRAENVLDQLRSDPVAGAKWVELFFRIIDAMEQSVERAVEGGDAGLDFGDLTAELDQAALAAAPTGSWSIPRAEPAPVTPAAAAREVRVVIRSDAIMKGARAAIVLHKAEALGRVSGVRPPTSAFEQDDFDGRFAFQFEGAASEAVVMEALRSAGDVADVAFGDAAPVRDLGAAGRGRQIRIDVRSLDAVMNLVGQLVVAKGRLAELAAESGSPDLKLVSTRVARIGSDLYGEVMRSRLTPVWQVFDRFPRVVRDLARKLGKRVRFEVDGEETQLDRAILDELGEPLIHLLRNAVDHGIESPADRGGRGKSGEGLVRISAANDRATVLIRITDDGRGIDRDQMLGKAVEMGFAAPDAAELTDDLLLKVLARPGFTTAENVTDVSGRGMGMDAVITRIRTLGGSVEVDTEVGRGSTFTLRLPMTLAIVRALLARIGTERYAIPLAGVTETVELHADRLAALDGREAYVLRDRLIPTVRLRERLGIDGGLPPGRQPALIVELGERRAAVVVDALLGQQEIVVEPFDAPRGTFPIFTGATILGDGAPALIVDPAALV